MSTTYTIAVDGKSVEIARTHFNGERAELTWLNPLASLLADEEWVGSDSGNPSFETVGELRELEVPKMWDDMTKDELIAEIKRVRDERDKIILREREEASKTTDALDEAYKEVEDLEGDVARLKDEVHELVVDKDEVANANMHFEDGLEAKLKSAIHEITDAEEQMAILEAELEMVKDQRFKEVKTLEHELEETKLDLEEEADRGDEFKTQRDFWKSKSNAFENELEAVKADLKAEVDEVRSESADHVKNANELMQDLMASRTESWGETQLLTREKEITMELEQARKALSKALQESIDREAGMKTRAEDAEQTLESAKSFTDDLKEAREALSNALQESLDREAAFRQEIRVMKQKDLDDTTFEDYTEIRKMVQGKGDLWEITHGEFLEVLKKTLESLEDNKSNAVHFKNALGVAHNEAAAFRKEIRKLKKDLLTINDVVIEGENFTITIFGETRSDGRGGFFEHYIRGEDFGGGLWFDFNSDGKKYLRDYDGVSVLPKEVADTIESQSISVDGIVTDDDSKSFDSY